jgi:hypothetical protein
MNTRKILEQLLEAQKQKDVTVNQVKTSVESEVTATVLNGVTPEKETTVVTKEEKVLQTKVALKKPTCYVTVEFGGNVNLGDYNMGKVRVGISIPTGVEINEELRAEVDSVYQFANSWVSKRVETEIQSLLKTANRYD